MHNISHYLFSADWKSIFIPSVPLLEIFIRGTLVYLLLFSLLRFFVKRQAGQIGLTDLLVILLIANAVQNALGGTYTSFTDGALLACTIVFWSFFLNWLGYHFAVIQRFVHPPPLALIKDGQLLKKNMRQELITEGELFTQLRKQGVDSIGHVKAAYMEGDGNISIITNQEKVMEEAGVILARNPFKKILSGVFGK